MSSGVMASTGAKKLSVSELETDLAQPAIGRVFGEEELSGLPEPVQRYFRAAIAPGTPLAVSAHLRMRGSIKLGGRWLPFRAHQVPAPHRGFVWAASVAGGLFAGSDQYVDGQGWMNWKILGLIPFVGVDGPDVSRSAGTRAAAEAVWVPTALLPRFGVSWTAQDETHVTARYRVDNIDLAVHYTLDSDAHVLSVEFDRWGDPGNTRAWGLHAFGLDTTGYGTCDGVTIPRQGHVGWFHGTERWADGEFFRFAITELRLVRPRTAERLRSRVRPPRHDRRARANPAPSLPAARQPLMHEKDTMTTTTTIMTPPILTRRRLLEAVGGIGLVVVGGTLYRAFDQGVFSTGQGPAYEPWREWSAQTGDAQLMFVRAAVLATNAHNTQPWFFRLSPDRIDLYAVPDRNIGTIDPLRREMYLSLGCALENLALAAGAQGRVAALKLMPEPTDQTLAARIDLSPAGSSMLSPLHAAIPARHTNRAAYADRPVAPELLTSMQSLIDVPEVGVIWFADSGAKRTFADLTVRATEAIIADAEQSADDFAWYRTSWSELQAHKDGITLDAAGLGPLLRTAGKLLPVSQKQSDDGWLTATRDTQVPTAAAFGTLVVHESRSNAQRMQAGRIWQRMHLWATTQGLAVQPLNQVVERAEREQTAGLESEFTRALAAMIPQTGWQAVMPFRIGYPTQEALLSPRRPAEDVVGS